MLISKLATGALVIKPSHLEEICWVLSVQEISQLAAVLQTYLLCAFSIH